MADSTVTYRFTISLHQTPLSVPLAFTRLGISHFTGRSEPSRTLVTCMNECYNSSSLAKAFSMDSVHSAAYRVRALVSHSVGQSAWIATHTQRVSALKAQDRQTDTHHTMPVHRQPMTHTHIQCQCTHNHTHTNIQCQWTGSQTHTHTHSTALNQSNEAKQIYSIF